MLILIIVSLQTFETKENKTYSETQPEANKTYSETQPEANKTYSETQPEAKTPIWQEWQI
jgi:hypothetical protein